MKKIISLVIILMLVGCVGTRTVQIPVSDTIPPQTQLQLNTAANKSVDFNFKGLPNAKRVVVSSRRLKNVYSIDKPLNQLFHELIKTKFQKISPQSENKVDVKITKFHTNTTKSMNTVKMTVAVKLKNGNQKDERTFTYDTSVGFNFGFGSYKFMQSEPINQLLLKFVVATDKYIDTFYEIK